MTVDTRSHPVVEGLLATPVLRALADGLPGSGDVRTVGGVAGSAGTALAAALHAAFPTRIFVLVAPDPEKALRVLADLQSLLGEEEARLYPQLESRPYGDEGGDPRIEGLRVEAVEALLGGRSRLFVTTPRGLQERLVLPDRLTRLELEIRRDEEIPFSLLVEELESLGYERVPLVEEVGQFAVRGGLLDVFSLGLSDPVRIEFWGDEVTSLRSFDVSDQRSRAELTAVRLLPARFSGAEEGGDGEGTSVRSLLELLPSDTLLVGTDESDWDRELRRLWNDAERIRRDRREGGESLPEPHRIFVPPDEAARKLHGHPVLRFRTGSVEDEAMDLGAEAPPAFDRDLSRLEDFLRDEAQAGARSVILCDNQGQVERLEEILAEGDRLPPGLRIGVGAVEGGFRLPGAEPRLNVLTDHEIFRRSRRLRSGRRFRGAVALESLAQLTPGDYVVHLDHGVGRFRGLERIPVDGEDLEVLAIEYANEEVLRVPVYRLDLVERWVGASDDSEPPAVHRIGGKRWKTLKRRTREAIEKMTRELLELYAERELAQGVSFSPDTPWQRKMEASFLYDDTPDQERVTGEVKEDMESARPMDRLICGDVGFGKTEVAIRAAFKAVQDGKQVAVLAPTTILVEQHRRTFQQRLADFPVRVEALSRFRSPREQARILAELADGKVDVVIGTHRLLSPDVRFRDLGLLVVDEEQRFGVRHKERLKKLRTSVDALTLTATPIPRTLQLSLGGMRDLSLIRTPPRDRLAVVTQAIPWNDGLIFELLARETDRGGQVFFLHNRVETIHTVAERVRKLAPRARVEVAHGQMAAAKLDGVMRRFIDGETDILVCSSIIENGLDVPNANTLVVDRADRFGLAQLYQIRGRVGRSDRRAYCYLVVPDEMTDEAGRRIRVLEHYTELGSGYEVALRDLEIRGAGNLLGANQSGFAHAVGMDTYLRLLEETVRTLRHGEGEGKRYPEPEVSLAGSAYIPSGYVSDSGQKLHLYRRLSRLEDRREVASLGEEIRDRYGPIPGEVERLLDAHLLRLLGTELGLERILVRERQARLTFRPAATPRMTELEGPFRDRQVEVEVKRVMPLSLLLTRAGPEALTGTLIRALSALAEKRRPAEGSGSEVESGEVASGV